MGKGLENDTIMSVATFQLDETCWTIDLVGRVSELVSSLNHR